MDTSSRNRWIIGSAVAVVILMSSMMYSVPEGRVAVVTLFGKPVRVAQNAGLKAKLPLPFERVIMLDARSRLYETRLTETLTKDKKNVILVTYAIWKVADPVRFVEAVAGIEGAEAKLDGVVTNAKNAVLGNYDFEALVSHEPDKQKLDSIEKDMLTDVQSEASSRYGINVVQIGLQRLSLPEENVRYVFDQMKAERAQYAAKFRAEGEKEAAKVRADTDLEAAKLRAEGEEKAEEIRGNAEAEAAKIYASAHKLDPEFYKFLRSLDSMDKMLGKNSTVVLDTDTPPFNVLKNPGR
jgi:modulator of FtsH protease HflC